MVVCRISLMPSRKTLTGVLTVTQGISMDLHSPELSLLELRFQYKKRFEGFEGFERFEEFEGVSSASDT